jgi:hypothetical protein
LLSKRADDVTVRVDCNTVEEVTVVLNPQTAACLTLRLPFKNSFPKILTSDPAFERLATEHEEPSRVKLWQDIELPSLNSRITNTLDPVTYELVTDNLS